MYTVSVPLFKYYIHCVCIFDMTQLLTGGVSESSDESLIPEVILNIGGELRVTPTWSG